MDSGQKNGGGGITGGMVWAIGLMSGTSCDGIDAALIRTNGGGIAEFGPGLTVPYDSAFRAKLKSCFGATGGSAATGGKGPIAEVERELTERHAAAVRALLEKSGRSVAEIAVVGFHGQTLHHAPERRETWQIGDGALLASLTGIAVVNDFRQADVAAGGQGAPLVPVYHAALAAGLPKPLAVLNVGGVANVTWIGPSDAGAAGDLLAFDTGPGNALIDDWVLQHTGHHADIDGALARQGTVDETALARLRAEPFFAVKPPKSIDRQHFKAAAAAALAGLSPADGAATLVAFTAWAVGRARPHFPAPALQWLVCGGGRHNPVLMQALRSELGVPVRSANEAGWDGDALEAQAFAYLAVRSLRGLPLSFPTTTGVPQPMPGGRFHPATAAS